MSKDTVAFLAGFTAGAMGALGQMLTNPTPTPVQWAFAVMTALAGGFAGLAGKGVNATADKRDADLKAQGAASVLPTPVTVTNPTTEPVPTTDATRIP